MEEEDEEDQVRHGGRGRRRETEEEDEEVDDAISQSEDEVKFGDEVEIKFWGEDVDENNNRMTKVREEDETIAVELRI